MSTTPDCPGCANPSGGLVIQTCRACKLRDLARGPEFFESMRRQKLTPAYVEQLRALGDPAAVHVEVRAAAKQYDMGSVRA